MQVRCKCACEVASPFSPGARQGGCRVGPWGVHGELWNPVGLPHLNVTRGSC